jgi:outer membrane lipoprotein LolB
MIIKHKTLRRVSFRSSFVLLACLLLSGCPSLQLAPLNKDQKNYQHIKYTERKKTLSQFKAWDISGAFSVTYLIQIPHAHFNTQLGDYTWQQSSKNRSYNITLSATSLKVKTLTLKGDKSGVEMNRGDSHPPIYARSPDLLIKQVLGYPMPISYLYYWIRDLPASQVNASNLKYDSWGHLISMTQDGWTIEFKSFIHTPKMDLPRLIECHQGRFSLRLAVHNWKLK